MVAAVATAWLLLWAAACAQSEQDFYDFKAVNIRGKLVSLEKYRGSVSDGSLRAWRGGEGGAPWGCYSRVCHSSDTTLLIPAARSVQPALPNPCPLRPAATWHSLGATRADCALRGSGSHPEGECPPLSALPLPSGKETLAFMALCRSSPASAPVTVGPMRTQRDKCAVEGVTIKNGPFHDS